MTWQHHNPVRVLAGAGRSATLHQHLPEGPLLLLTSAGMLRRGTVARLLAHSPPQRQWTVRAVAPNPDLDALDAMAEALRNQPAGAITGIAALGGGSAMDAAKVLSVLLRQPQVAGLHRALREGQALDFSQALPVVCLPTTAGTGAEVTPFATVWDGVRHAKHSLADDALLPRLAILDPELTMALPWQETLYSALDAMSHALETLWNRHASPVSAGLALQALRLVVDHLPTVQHRPADLDARAQLQAAGLMAGMAISQNRTALAHAMSYPLTARHGVPHGLACSFTLAALLQWVQQQRAWTVAPPADLRDAVLHCLGRWRLADHLLGYCTQAQVLAQVDAMFDPRRAGNFALPAGRDEVLQVLSQSLQQATAAGLAGNLARNPSAEMRLA